jgi:hypothetical protein
VVLAHDRRRVLHFNVTEHPSAAWTAQQIVDAFPDDSASSYLLRDRDSVYGHVFRQRLKGMGIGEAEPDRPRPRGPHGHRQTETLTEPADARCRCHSVCRQFRASQPARWTARHGVGSQAEPPAMDAPSRPRRRLCARSRHRKP